MVRCVRWHCPPDTGFEIQTLAVWGRARYLPVTEALHNTEFYEWMEKKHFCFFQTAKTGKRTPNSSVKGSGANYYPRVHAPLHLSTNAKGGGGRLNITCAEFFFFFSVTSISLKLQRVSLRRQRLSDNVCQLGRQNAWAHPTQHWNRLEPFFSLG